MQRWIPDTCPRPGCDFVTFVLPDGEEACFSVAPCSAHAGVVGTPQDVFEFVRSENWAANTAVNAVVDELPNIDPTTITKVVANGTRDITITVPGLAANRVNAVRAQTLVKFNQRHALRGTALAAIRSDKPTLDAIVAEVDRVTNGDQPGSTKLNRAAFAARGDAVGAARCDFAIAQLAAWKAARAGGTLPNPPAPPARPSVTIVAV